MASTPPSAPLRAVLFDAYGTLFDVYSVGELAEALFPGHGAELARLWRDKQLDYTRLLTLAGRYRPFWELTRSGLRWAAQRLGLPLSADAESRLMNQYRRLGAFPENREVLETLRALGVRTGVLSNADPVMLSVAIASAGLDGLLDPVLSVHTVQRFKTDPAAYALGPEALGQPARDILFVSSNGWDAIGATWYGYTTLWVNRAGLPPEALDTEPTYTASDLRAVPEFFR